MSQSDVTAIVQDSTGFMWFATNNGLTRYDGNRFTVFKNDRSDPGSISSNTIFALTAAGSKLWVGSRKGVDCCHTLTDRFIRYDRGLTQSEDAIALTRVTSILTRRDEVWIAAAQGIFRYDPSHDLFQRQEIPEFRGRMAICLAEDSYGRLLIGTDRGLLCYDPESGHCSDPCIAPQIRQNRITALLTDEGRIWVGTKTGCYTIESATGIIREITCKGLTLYRVSALWRDSMKNIWIGSREGGVYRVTNAGISQICHNPRDPSSLSGNDVLSLCEDASGMMWIGTSTAGVDFTPLRQKPFTSLKHNPYNNSGLSSNVISALCPDENGIFWIATKDGVLNRYDIRSGAVEPYATAPEAPGAGAHLRISALLPCDDRRLYVGSGNGLFLFDKLSKQFTPWVRERLGGRYISTLLRAHDGRIWCGTNGGLFVLQGASVVDTYSVGNGRLTENNIRTLFEDSYGTIWIGTRDGGLNRYDFRDSGAPRYTVYRSGDNALNSDDVSAIYEDRQRRIWIGTWGGGLSRLNDREKGIFRTYTEREGLSDNVIFSINEDSEGKLWLSTYNGLSCFDPSTERFRNYTSSDGIAGNEFSVGAFCRTADHTLLLGGIDGLTIFDPRDVETNYLPASRFAVTELLVNNQTVRPGQRIAGRILLNRAAFATRRIVFPSKVRSFTLRLASFDYATPHAGSFVCKLEGFDPDWVYSSTRQPLVYANLRPGNYTLRVRSADMDDHQAETLLQITIRPPLWANPGAYSFYFLVVLSAGIFAVLRYKKRLEGRNKLLHQQMQQQSDAEIYNAKMRFYTNVSHELRTPLTLIVGLVNAIGERHAEDETMARQISVIRRNAELLQRLIGELLDLRQIETGNMTLHYENRDTVVFTRTILSYFEQTASNHGIALSFSASPETIEARLDFSKVEKIVYNLLSNAMKFTRTRIDTDVHLADHDGTPRVEIRVKDDGEGIRAEDIDRIFQRFYRNEEDNIGRTGTGIGLNLALEIARLHGGDILVESCRSEGSTFIVTLPQSLAEHMATTEIPEANTPAATQKSLVLLVDDNADMRYYIVGLLTPLYDVREASDGEQALKLARELLPDIILCDIMMPGIDGVDVCRELKASPRTSHIPVVMVTAKSTEESRIEGLQCGADSYIIKPFCEAHLQAQIASLISSREHMRSNVRREVLTTPQPAALESTADRKLHSIVELLDRNLSNSDYTVEQLSSDLFLSRMQLYRLLKNEVGQTPGEFLRDYRLNAAARLLTQHKINISEVGYMVGFADARYFRQCFKRKFGFSPREYANRDKSTE